MIVTGREGTGRPLWDIEPITFVAESAAVLKKMMMAISAMMFTRPENGSLSMRSNMTFSPEPLISIGSPLRLRQMVVPPKTTNHARDRPVGTSSTTLTNWRSVRPLEIFAMNMPTNGDQEIHQAQKSMV